MNGDTHATTGALIAVAVAPLLGLHTVITVLPFAVVTAGYALVSDLDHPGAAASRLGGPVTGWVCKRLCTLSAFAYRHTKTRRDVTSAGTHRHLTHTLVFALVLGGVAQLSTALWGPWAMLAWLVAGVCLAADRLGAVALVAYSIGLAGWLPLIQVRHGDLGHAVLAALDHTSPWLGVAVGLGCLVHDLGDCLTTAGVPLLWPLPLAGQRWRRLGTPRKMRFHTGGPAETRFVLPLAAAATVVELPGVGHLIQAATHAVLALH